MLVCLSAGGVEMLRSAVTLLAAAFMLASPASAEPKPPVCAFVDVSPMLQTEPKRHCFSMETRCSDDQSYGCFTGELQFEDGWIEESGQPRRRKLAAAFGYIDPDNVHWDVPAGYITDGASIPKFFQLFIGGPWTENYVKAAVIHDFYIRRKSVSAIDVHKVFYHALLASGTKRQRAEKMHFAVANFGPQWKHVDLQNYEAAWKARRALDEQIIRWNKEMWDAFQESERKRNAQAAIDTAVLNLPIEERTRVFRIISPDITLEAYDAFVEEAARANIVHLDRDSELLAGQRDAVAAELAKPYGQRTNVFLLQFTAFGATSGSFTAMNDAEFAELMRLTNQMTMQQEGALSSEPICLGGACTGDAVPQVPPPPAPALGPTN